jgi:hypothetical protein
MFGAVQPGLITDGYRLPKGGGKWFPSIQAIPPLDERAVQLSTREPSDLNGSNESQVAAVLLPAHPCSDKT